MIGGPSFRFFEAKNSDLSKVATLVNSAYRGESSRSGRAWTTEADLLGGQRTDAQVLAEDLRRRVVILCAESVVDRSLDGCVKLELDGELCHLGMLSVRPATQGQGLGRRLLVESENWARGKGAKHIELSVIQLRPELIAWYERRGYRKTGETGAFPYGDKAFGEPRRDDLYFEIFRRPL